LAGDSGAFLSYFWFSSMSNRTELRAIGEGAGRGVRRRGRPRGSTNSVAGEHGRGGSGRGRGSGERGRESGVRGRGLGSGERGRGSGGRGSGGRGIPGCTSQSTDDGSSGRESGVPGCTSQSTSGQDVVHASQSMDNGSENSSETLVGPSEIEVLNEIECVKNMKWCGKTTYNYTKSWTEFFMWLRYNKPNMTTDDENLSPSFSVAALQEFCNGKRKWSKKKLMYVNLSYSGLSRYRSALKWYIKKQKMRLEVDDVEDLDQYFQGLKKRTAKEKQEGTREMQEGKKEMPFEIYCALAKYWWSCGDFFSLLYLVLTWNLGCRTNNTEGIKMAHIGWYCDSLQIMFGVTKTNQEGDRRESRLIFANPDKPYICPVLILSIYLATTSTELSLSSNLFFGGNQSARFLKSLSKVLHLAPMVELLASLGLVPFDLGAHSIRKGAGTYLSTGTTSTPSHASICIRLSWSMGTTQERYLFYNLASDAYCGRLLCGLNPSSVRFALLPPHFYTYIPLSISSQLYPCTSSIPELERVRQFCTSSFLFHMNFLKSCVSSTSSLWYTKIYTSYTYLSTQFPVSCGLSSPVLTANGLPPHVLTWINQQEMTSVLAAIPEKILGGIGQVLKEQGVTAGNLTKEMLEDMMKRLLQTDRQNRGDGEEQQVPRQEENSSVFLWKDGMMHRVPEDFRFPSLSVSQCWLVWWEGNKEEKMSPWKFFVPHDIPKVELKRWSDIKCMMKEMIKVLGEEGMKEDDLRKQGTEELIASGRKAMQTFDRKMKKTTTRFEEWMVTTALRELREARCEKDLTRKRKQKAPKKATVKRNKNKRIRIS
jgi:hypothetical protein